MPISTLPVAPSRNDPANFSAQADAFLGALPAFGTEANALAVKAQSNEDISTSAAAALTLPGYTGTSSDSKTIGTGSFSFTTNTGKLWVPGMGITISSGNNYLKGTVTSYSGSSLVANITSTYGSGTYASWTIGLSSTRIPEFTRATVASAAAADIWAAASYQIDWTGTATATGFAAAPQAGAERVLICAGACSFTAGANMLIDGVASASTVTCAAGDQVIVRAVTTTQFKLSRVKYDGTAQVAPQILPITASVAGNALTCTIVAPTPVDFRSATLGSGTVATLSLAANASVVVPSTATLGTVSGEQSRIAILAINNAGTIEAAVVNLAGGRNLDETTRISTTAISTAANSASVIYSTTARSDVTFRVVGYVESTQATAGTWATAPSTIQGAGGNAATAMSSIGYGQTWQDVTASRALGTTYYNTTGKPIFLSVALNYNTASTGSSLTINGVLIAKTFDDGTRIQTLSSIVPPGQSYVVAQTGGTLVINTWAELR